MSSNDREENIRELYRRLKQVDERRAPSFGSVWQRAASRAGSPSPGHTLRTAALVSLGAIVVVSLVIVLETLHHEPAIDVSQSILEWQSPTSALLHIPNEELFRNLPDLGTGYFERAQSSTEEL